VDFLHCESEGSSQGAVWESHNEIVQLASVGCGREYFDHLEALRSSGREESNWKFRKIKYHPSQAKYKN
jgi:hypothetical protein